MAEYRIESKNGDGEDVELLVKTPSAKVLRNANKAYAAAFREALASGMLVKRKLKDYLRDQGLWDDEREQEYLDLLDRIGKAEVKLNTGKDEDGNKVKVSDGREISLQLMKDRTELRALIAEQQGYDSNTAEGYADNERFFSLVAACTYDFLTQQPYFSSLQDYKDRDSEPAAIDAANKLATLVFGVDDDYEKTLTEYKFLKRFGMVDEDGFLVNKDGEYVDEEGNLIEKPEVADGGESKDELFDVEEAEFEDDLDVSPNEAEASQDSDDAHTTELDEVEDSPDDIIFSSDD
jgi:hypothetical protein